MVVAIQNASCAADPYVSFTKTVAPVTPAECNKWLVTVTAAGVGTYTKPVDVLLVIDRSGSMSDGTPSRLSSAKSAAINFANLVLASGNPGNRIGVVSFASDVTINTGFTTSLTTVTSAINSLNANGGTNTEYVFNVAGGLFPATPPCDRVQVLIFLSDGVPTVGSLQNCGFDGTYCAGSCGSYTTSCNVDCCNSPGGPNCCTNGAISQSATAKARANVYSIGLVTGMTNPTLTVAREVFNRVQDSGYYEAPSPSDLNAIYAQIAGQLQLAVTSGAVTENIDSIGTDFNIVGTPTTTAGTAAVSGNVITWNGFNVAFGTPATMTYTMTPKSGVCGDQILGGSSMTYTTVSCTSNTLTATSAPTSASVTCLTAAISPDPTAVCQGSTLQLNGNPSLNGVPLADGAAGYTHKWTGTGATYLTADNIQKPIFQSTAPAGSYTLIYTVTDSRGCTAADTNTITVYSRPTATISPTSICLGSTLQLNGNPSGGLAPYTTHAWTGAGATYLSATNIQNPIFKDTAPVGTYSLTYTVTDSHGCTGSDTKTITVHSRPVAAITPDPASVCQGSTLPLNGNPSGGSGSYTTHAWTGAGATYLSATNIQNPIFKDNAPAGSYALTYTVTDSNGCTGSDTVTVTVNSRPTATISPTSVCQGTALQLNGNPSGGSGSYTTHAWTGDTTYLSPTNIQNPVLSASAPAGTYSLTYTVTDSNGCIGSDTKTITVRSRPTASITPDPADVCQGFTLQINGNPSGGSGSYTTHAWTGDTGYLSATNIQNPVLSAAAPAGTYSLTYTVTDSNGCIGSDTITVNVGAKPTVLAGSDQSICIEDDLQTVKLTATASDYDSIVWTQESGPGTFEAGSNALEIIFHPDYDSSIAYSETAFKVQAIAKSPCSGTETASDNVMVMVSMKPETDIVVTF